MDGETESSTTLNPHVVRVLVPWPLPSALPTYADTHRVRVRPLQVELDDHAPFDASVLRGEPMSCDAAGLDAFLDRWELGKVRLSVAKLRRRREAARRNAAA